MTLTEALNLTIEKYPFMAAFARPAFTVGSVEDENFNITPAPASAKDLEIYQAQYPANNWGYDGTRFTTPLPWWGYWHPSKNLYRPSFWLNKSESSTRAVVEEYLLLNGGDSTFTPANLATALAYLYIDCFKVEEKSTKELSISGDDSVFTLNTTLSYNDFLQEGEPELLIHRLQPRLISNGLQHISAEEADVLLEKGILVKRQYAHDGWVRFTKDRARMPMLDSMKVAIKAHLSAFFPNVVITNLLPVNLNYHSDGSFEYTPDALNLPEYGKDTVFDTQTGEFLLVKASDVDEKRHSRLHEPALYSGKGWKLNFTFAENFDPLVGTSIFFATPEEVCDAYQNKNESIFSDLKEVLEGVDLMYVSNSNWCERNGYEDKEKSGQINLASPVRKHLRVWQWCLGPMANKCQSTGRPLPLKMFTVNGFERRSLDTFKI